MKYLFLCGAALLVATPVMAQNASQEIVIADRLIPETEITVLANGFALNRDQTGQDISVLTQFRLDQLQSVTIADALRTLPGTAVAQRGTTGSQTSVFVRGGNSSQTLVLIDGVRVNDPSSPNAAFDFGGLLTGNVVRVEVLRGPNAVVWGSQALGGIVNVETATPSGRLALNAGMDYGSLNTLNARANVAGGSGPVEASFGAAFNRTDGISQLIGTATAERDGNRNLTLNGKLKVNFSDSISLDLRGLYSNARLDYDSPFSGGANSLAVARNRQWLGMVGLNAELFDGRFHNRLAYSRSDIHRRGADPVIFSFNNYDVTGTTDHFEYRGAYDFSDLGTLTAGVEHERIFSSISFEGAAPDLARDTVTSVYGQLSVRPFEGLNLTGGVRHDGYSTYGGHTTLGGNLSYSPNGGQTVIRAAYGEGFRAPTLTEGQPPFGNPKLKPETARNLDIGIEQALFDGKLHGSLTWFQRKSTNQIVYSFRSSQSENIEKVDSNGLELAVTADPTGTLHFEANYTLTNAINGSGANIGKRLQLRPRNSGYLSLDWTSPFRLKLGASLHMVGNSYDDAANTVRLAGYNLASLRATYPLTDKVELYGRVENLFDAQYQTVARYSSYGRTATIGIRARY